MKTIYSLRQHDLDQVIRVERGSLLSVPQRGTPRSIVTYKYNLNFQAVNSKNNAAMEGGWSRRWTDYVPAFVIARGGATLPSSAIHEGSNPNRAPGNR